MPAWTVDDADIKWFLTARTLERDKGGSSICLVAKNLDMRVCMGNLNDIYSFQGEYSVFSRKLRSKK